MVNKNMFKLNKITIPKDEVLRYLGYKKQQIDKNLDNIINQTIEESINLINPKFTFKTFIPSIKEEGVLLEGTTLILKGKDITNHLKSSKETVIMAVTVGSEIERKIKYYEKTELTKALIMDACATTAVEEVCDRIEEYVIDSAKDRFLETTFRYSPGYGDLPLSIQRDFINTINAGREIGLTVSPQNLLMPRKSVTAIIGLIPKGTEKVKKSGCEVCKNFENCSFRKEGVTCGS